MKYNQRLDNYKEDYKKWNGWVKKETPRYVFHFCKNTIAEKDIKKILLEFLYLSGFDIIQTCL